MACINWGHATAPKAIAYRIADEGWAECEKYFPTWREAYDHADRTARGKQ
ncbi:hypothetical protein GCM10007173_13630 [Glutamicibacter ardleyensis]|uniref:Uncharacterized protein n=1 Tax=Glutamicibacter ardleyensis TaxID=225894 RepID=A0ABQ2DHS4_9MICC|nr:hypothetical protein GCM10007173_13630 [Glutamicibacter ardleyensis]